MCGKLKSNNNKIVWKGYNMQGQPLPDGVYFYILIAGNNTYKGWVELTR